VSKILLISPNKWGRGITPIWIASHSGCLKLNSNHQVQLFDCTFYKDWTNDELSYNVKNYQFMDSDYLNYVKFSENNVHEDLQETIDAFNPDIIFCSALSSHIHGEGEYVNIQYSYNLIENVDTDAIIIAGGLQATAKPKEILDIFPKLDFLIGGDSELILKEIADSIDNNKNISTIKGISYYKDASFINNSAQGISKNMDDFGIYDYSVFSEQIFYRPYNGEVVKAVDYEMSRGCIYTCSYCVETIVQSYYGFTDSKKGVLKSSNKYLRNKTAERIFLEIKHLVNAYNIKLFRCQDTNFLTIDKAVLNELARLIDKSGLDFMLYIETRPEGITEKNVALLKKLKVDGVGMGIEVSEDGFREDSLNRFASQQKIISAFRLLKETGIKRTSYNIIGLPGQTEEMILNTIQFNRILQPDNITTAFYSPYIGTLEEEKSKSMGYSGEYEFNADAQLRSVINSDLLSTEILNFYKENFVSLMRDSSQLSFLKAKYANKYE
jgi:anaerobic magnesium-protoporphyrin IX monomethyl ester cyclase